MPSGQSSAEGCATPSQSEPAGTEAVADDHGAVLLPITRIIYKFDNVKYILVYYTKYKR
jgi:hypothetical protein